MIKIIAILLLTVVAARADDAELCERGAKIMVDGFARDNPKLAPDFFHLENVKVAFPTSDGVICQADFVFNDPRVTTRNGTFPVRTTDDGKVRVCNVRGQCTAPQ